MTGIVYRGIIKKQKEKNLMKKKILLCILTSIALLFCACGSKDTKSSQVKTKTTSNSETLYRQGLDVVSLMSEMAGNDDFGQMAGSNEIENVVENIRCGDYSKPSAVYRINMSDGILEQIISISGVNSEDFTRELKEYMQKRMKKSMASMINANYGASAVAASAIYHADKIFVYNEGEKDEIYIYTYDTGYPVMVTFTAGEEGAFLADGSFILDDEFEADTKEKFQEFLDETMYFKGCSAEKLDI